jgi:hypothetical protein
MWAPNGLVKFRKVASDGDGELVAQVPSPGSACVDEGFEPGSRRRRHGRHATDRHKDGYTPLHRACWGRAEGHTETVRVLLKAGAPADQMSDKGELPVDLTPNANTKKLIKHRLQKTAKVQISMDKDEM